MLSALSCCGHDLSGLGRMVKKFLEYS